MATPKIGFESLCWEYDVFLSFRGEDTRKTFTGHLRAALRHASIHTFIDEDELKRGEYLASEFTTAIQSSRIAMIVFSKDYASSRWCLEDYGEVRNQRENYGDALAKHEERFGGSDKVQQWRDALTKVGNMSGWDLHGDLANGYESKFIDEIIKEVILIVSRVPVSIPNHVVGLQYRVKHVVKSMWGEHDNIVRMIGIYGVGGVGKTTLAQVLYNKFFGYFERSCFLEVSSGISDITKLQEGLLSKLLSRNIEVGSEGEGIMFIKQWLQAKKCLIVLDNLEHMNQFEALCGGRDWFGSENLRQLSFWECSSLVEVHSSIGELEKLVSLDLFGCTKLKKLPNTFSQLSSLQELRLYGNNMYDLPSNMSNFCMLQSIELSPSNNLKVLQKLSHTVNYLDLGNCYNLIVIQEFPSNLRDII